MLRARDRDLARRIGGAAVWLLLAGIASAQTEPAAAEASLRNEAAALVQQLGSESFAHRERASNRLREIGLPARQALAEGSGHPDREIRYRCKRILGIVDELDFERRLAAFATGRSDGRDLPGWSAFRGIFVDDGESRAVFIDMQRSESAVMAAIGRGGAGLPAIVDSRCAELQQSPRMTGRPIGLGSILALLFAVFDDQVAINLQTGSHLCSFCYQPPVSEALLDPSKQQFVRALLGALIKRSEGWMAHQTMALAMRYGLEDGLVPATKVLKNPGEQPVVRQNAILAVARLGDQRHVGLLEGLLEDSARCSAQRINNVTYETQVRDVALAAILAMRGQDPRQFGFERIQFNETNVFSTSSAGFENEDRRRQAFQKYEEYRQTAVGEQSETIVPP